MAGSPLAGVTLGLLLSLTACSNPSVRTIAVPDLLGISGRQAVMHLTGSSASAFTWQQEHRVPLGMPSLSSLSALTVPVGTSTTWRISVLANRPALNPSRFPETIAIRSASWRVRVYNDEGELAMESRVPIGAALRKSTCSENACEYTVERAADLLGFQVGGAQMPEAPPRWPRAFSTIVVDVALTLDLVPHYYGTAAEQAEPFEISFSFQPGPATIVLGSLTGNNP